MNVSITWRDRTPTKHECRTSVIVIVGFQPSSGFSRLRQTSPLVYLVTIQHIHAVTRCLPASQRSRAVHGHIWVEHWRRELRRRCGGGIPLGEMKRAFVQAALPRCLRCSNPAGQAAARFKATRPYSACSRPRRTFGFPGIPHSHVNKSVAPSSRRIGLAKNPAGLSLRNSFRSPAGCV